MDMAAMPKIVAAFAIGAAIAAPARQAISASSDKDSVLITLEWIGTDGGRTSEKLTLRTAVNVPTVTRQGTRTVEVTPLPSVDGSVDVRLNIVGSNNKGAADELNTLVHAKSGDTNVVMASATKGGRDAKERMIFLTAERL